jgi:hypothetical protein
MLTDYDLLVHPRELNPIGGVKMSRDVDGVSDAEMQKFERAHLVARSWTLWSDAFRALSRTFKTL